MFSLRPTPAYFKWAPKEDITTYELARCLEVMIASQAKYASTDFVKAVYDSLPDSSQRHFEVLVDAKAA